MLNRYRLFFALAVYVVCFVLLYPLYQYLFDDDGVGYLMVTRRLAAGDFYNGVNGFWSPLHSWLVVPLYKLGLNEFTAFRLSNGLIGAGILIAVNRLFRQITVSPVLKTIALFTCIPITLAFVFHDLAADILLCFLILVYLNLATEKDLFEKPGKNIACGLVGSLCYLAKSYAFPFFFIHFFTVQLFLFKRSLLPAKQKMLLLNLALGTVSCLLLAAPWIYLLHDRYQIMTFGLAGKVNYMTTLFPEYTAVNETVAVPPAPLCSFWENPYYLLKQHKPYPSLFSMDVLIRQIRIMLETFMVMLRCLNNLSFFCSTIIFLMGLYLLKRKDRFLILLFLTITVFPIGYLLVHIETRYIWPITFLLLISGIVLLQAVFTEIRFGSRVQLLCWVIFFGSFLIYPINYLKDSAGSGKELFELAKEVQAKGIKGKLLSNGEGYSKTRRLAYLTDNTDCIITNASYSYDELLTACREKGIDYFFYYYNSPSEKEVFKNTVFYRNAIAEVNMQYPGLLLLKMK